MALDQEQLQQALEVALQLVEGGALDQLGLNPKDKEFINGLLGKVKNKENLSLMQKRNALDLVDRLAPKTQGALSNSPELQNLVLQVMDQMKGTQAEKKMLDYLKGMLP